MEEKLFAEFRANVEREIAEANAKKAGLETERKRRLAQNSIPPEAIATYTRLISARDGQPLAALDGRTCQACFNPPLSARFSPSVSSPLTATPGAIS